MRAAFLPKGLAPAGTPTDPVVATCVSFDVATTIAAMLAGAGFARSRISVVARGADRASTSDTIEQRLHGWSWRGALLGAIFGLGVGAALVASLMAPLFRPASQATVLLIAFEGAILGGAFSAMAAAMSGLGLPLDDASRRETDAVTPDYVVLVHGTCAEQVRARAIAGRQLGANRSS